MFTKVHHAKIADAIRNTKAAHPGTPAPLDTLQAELARIFGADGSDFSPREFEAGCNPEQPQRRATA
jgi:hypothetical protein